MQTMYPGKVNSPQTELASAIDDEQTTIPLLDASVLPDPPNLATIGTGENAETVLYEGKNGNDLTDVTRGFQGNAKAWSAGAKVARLFTEYDYKALADNIRDLAGGIDDLAGEGRTTETVKGNADALAALLAETVDKFPKRGFWEDIEPGANIWRFGDRVLVGDAVDQDGNKSPTVRSWVGVSANGYMTYFDSRSQMEIISKIGGIGIASASRSSDNDRIGERNTIGIASYVDNDNTNAADKKSAWAYYGHAVQSQPNLFTVGMEIAVADISGGPFFESTPYGVGGLTAAWLAVGGETIQSGEVATAYAANAIAIATSAPNDPMSKFDKGIVFGANAIAGTDGVTGTGVAMEMAKGHELVWRYSGVENAVGAKIRSDVTGATLQTRIIFEDAGFFVKGVASDFTTEVNLFQVITNPDAINYVSISPNASGGGVGVLASGKDANIDLRLQPKGDGMLNYIKNAITASNASSFTATHYVPIKLNGVTYYIPASASTW